MRVRAKPRRRKLTVILTMNASPRARGENNRDTAVCIRRVREGFAPEPSPQPLSRRKRGWVAGVRCRQNGNFIPGGNFMPAVAVPMRACDSASILLEASLNAAAIKSSTIS